MTKLAKAWKTVSFWTKIKAVISAAGAGGELSLLLTDCGAKWHVVMIAATLFGIVLTNFIEDKNNNGIVDLLEDDEKPNE